MVLWKDVRGYEGLYEVSNFGEMRSSERRVKGRSYGTRMAGGKLLELHTDPKGYLRVTLWKAGKRETVKVHQVVLEAFVCVKPYGMQCCHWNRHKQDNRISNLRWGTPIQNAMDNRRHGVYNKNSGC
jgi:hypothetical protein